MIESAHILAGMFCAGTGCILLWVERFNRITRPLAVCLLSIGVELLIRNGGVNDGWWVRFFSGGLETLSVLAGMEWGRRVGQTADTKLGKAANGLFRAAQIVILVFGGLVLGYYLVLPEQAMMDADGVFRVQAGEIAIFAPLMGAGLLLSTIAIMLLLATRIDKAEVVRLRALSLAAPFLIAAMVLHEDYVPFTIGIGLLIFLAGTMRYLFIQGQRGQFMSQFLSPEVAKLVRSEGLRKILHRERRDITVLFADLRGFTAYARERDSNDVIKLLERYYNLVGEVAAEHGGTIKDHAGDGVLVLIGAPLASDDQPQRAVALAAELMQRGQALLAENAPTLGLGIGIATGTVTLGAIQGAGRLEYVAVGNAVNLAARLSDRAANGEVLVDGRSAAAIVSVTGLSFTPREPMAFKGFDEPLQVSAVKVA